MINKICFTVIALAVVCSCNNSSKTGDDIAGKDSLKITGETSHCYRTINDKDTIDLQLKVEGRSVSGTMNYNLLEKDKNAGTLQGEMIGDTIFASYSFMSEGTESVREIAFIKSGDNLIEGFGPVEDINGKVVFKNRSALVFDSANLLSKVDCASGQ